MPLPVGFALGAFLRALFSKAAAGIYAFIIWVFPWLIEKAVQVLGVGILTYVGLDVMQEQLEQQFFATFNNIPADIYQILLLAKVDLGMKITFAAMAAAIAIKTTFAGGKLIFRGAK